MSSPVDSPSTLPMAPPLIRKGELEFRAFPSELEVQVWDYHADPVHLSLEELDAIGLVSSEERTDLLTSQVALWRQALREGKVRDAQIPQLSEDASARALHLGGLALLPVSEGLDVYVVSYDATPVRLNATWLARLGLRYREP